MQRPVRGAWLYRLHLENERKHLRRRLWKLRQFLQLRGVRMQYIRVLSKASVVYTIFRIFLAQPPTLGKITKLLNCLMVKLLII